MDCVGLKNFISFLDDYVQVIYLNGSFSYFARDVLIAIWAVVKALNVPIKKTSPEGEVRN